ncbi:MAG TPA: zf-HC2 domain-containing protein [Candidatus Cybelea sp.]|nr:zf-HC2 domain-containing protein [Candidatus Cybelea sp.]
MNWTCEQTEARLSDYLDGLLQSAEQSAFNQHVNTCEKCAPLVAAVARTLGGLYAMEPVEAPAELENAILTATLGAPSWRNLRRWLKSLQSPRFVYSMASVAATFVVILTASGFSFRKPKLAELRPATIYRNADRKVHLVYAQSAKFVSDLRVVLEIQTLLNANEQNPTSREQTIPQNSPNKEPGRTDNTNPSAPKQQNRADEIGRNLWVLASQFPVLSGSMGERRIP